MCENQKDGTGWLAGGKISGMGTATDFQIWLSIIRPLIEDLMTNLSHTEGY